MSDSRPTIILDLRGVEPRPERVLEIVSATLALGSLRIALDWGGRFPWSVDSSVCAPDCFPDELPAEASRLVSKRGSLLLFILRNAFPDGYSARPGYRHLERAGRDHDVEWAGATRKLVSDLLDDARAVMPELQGVLVPSDFDEWHVVADAACEVGLAMERFDATLVSRGVYGVSAAAEDSASREPRCGGIEERLVLQSHPAATGQSIVGAHERLREWRSNAWLELASLHETITAIAGARMSPGRDLVIRKRRLAGRLAEVPAIRDELRRLYDGLAVVSAVDRTVLHVSAPVREQYSMLSARLSTLRSLRW